MTYAFCFSLPYGIIVSFGGLIAFFRKEASISLIFYLFFGGAISAALGYSAYQKYFTNSSDRNENVSGLVVSAVLAFMTCSRWSKSGNIMPIGVVALLSVLMTVFFVYRLLNPLLPRKLN